MDRTGFWKVTLCFVLFGAVCASGAEDSPRALRDRLSQEVKHLSLASGALPGCILVSAGEDRAVPLAYGNSNGTEVPVAAAAVSETGGRVVAAGHTAFFEREAASDAANLRFLRECLIWLARGKAPETVYLGERQNGLRPALERALKGVRLSTVRSYAELAKLPANAVFVTFPDNFPRSNAPALRTFVERGGGALCFSVGWGWSQLSGGKSFATANTFNAALTPFGLFTCGRAVYAAAESRFPLIGRDGLPGSSAEEALRILSAGGKTPTPAMLKRCMMVLGEGLRALPEEDGRWRPQLIRLARESGRQTISPSRPLGTDRARERLGHILFQNEWQSKPEQIWPAHPSAATYPGIPADGTPRVTLEVEIALDIPRWHGTGLFAVAGEPLTVTLPPGGEKRGLRVRVGTTSCDLTSCATWTRAPLVTMELPLNKKVTTFSSPFGGLVYVTVPGQRTKSKETVRVKIGPACPAARFVEGRDTPETWRESLRTSPAPFAEIENDVIALTVPLEDARNGSDPREVLALWRQILKNDAWLSGIPETRAAPERMCFDVQLCMGYMHSGYPIMLPRHTIPHLLNMETMRKGDQDEVWGFFHEMGHNHQSDDWTFDGTVEVTVNFFSLYNMEKICGKMPRQTEKMGNAGLRRNVARWKAAGRPFREWKSDPFLALDFFVELRMKYGWDAFRKLFEEYRRLPASERPKSDLDKRRQWCERFSRIVGEDLTDEFSFMLEDKR